MKYRIGPTAASLLLLAAASAPAAAQKLAPGGDSKAGPASSASNAASGGSASPSKTIVAPAPTTSNSASGSPTTKSGVLSFSKSDKQLILDVQPPPTDAACSESVVAGGTKYKVKKLSAACAKLLPTSRVKVILKDEGVEADGNAIKVQAFITSDGEKTYAEVAKLAKESPQTVAVMALVLENESVLVSSSVSVGGVGRSAAEFGPCKWSTDSTPADTERVDIDLAHGGGVVRAPSRSVILQTVGLIVNVCHELGPPITVEWGGTRGLSSLGTNDQRGVTHGESEPANKATPKTESVISTFRFPPRQPGSADITVYQGSGDKKTPLATTELEVDKLYWGAVRLGLGTTFGDWRSYEIATFAGSRQTEAREQRSAVAFEIVAGFAPYLFDLWARGGRSHTGSGTSYLAPFIGFGLVGAQASGVEALSSIHMGFEIEFASSFSIATNFIMRRTPTLDDGYQSGSPIGPGMTVDGITHDSWKPGFGLVVNASPSFLQFATGTQDSSAPPAKKSENSPAKEDAGKKPAEGSEGGGK